VHARRERRRGSALLRAEASASGLALSRRERLGPDVAAPPADEELESAFAPADFYSLLDVGPDATLAEVKDAYRRLQKVCHPDVEGEDGTECSVLLNEAYSVLSDPSLRCAYDDTLRATKLFAGAAPAPGLRPYTGDSYSAWRGCDPRGGGWEQRSVFVDEGTCIGCKNCTHCAPDTFAIEDEWGRARVFAQWADTESNLQTAIDSCPVDCIHWVPKRSLPVLEFVMQAARRVSVAAAKGGGVRSEDPFELGARFTSENSSAPGKRAPGGVPGSAAAAGTMALRLRSAWLKLGRRTREQWGPREMNES